MFNDVKAKRRKTEHVSLNVNADHLWDRDRAYR